MGTLSRRPLRRPPEGIGQLDWIGLHGIAFCWIALLLGGIWRQVVQRRGHAPRSTLVSLVVGHRWQGSEMWKQTAETWYMYVLL